MSEQTRAESSGPAPTQPGGVNMDMGPAQPEPVKPNTRFIVIVLVVVVVLLALIVLAVIGLYSNPGLTVFIRDLFIIAMALMSIVIGLTMVILIFQLQALIALLRNEIKPMLTNANQTVSTVRGTAVFVSDNLVKPAIGIASFFAGLKGAQQAIIGKVNTAGRRPSGARATQSPSPK